MLDTYDIGNLARFLVDRHGLAAVHYTDRAIRDLEALGDPVRAEAWRTLRCLVMDLMVSDPIPPGLTAH